MRKLKFILLLIVMLLIILSIPFFTSNIILKNKKLDPLSENDFSISCYTSGTINYVTLHFKDIYGIKSISYSADNYTIFPNGKKEVAIDYKIEKNKEYIFSVTDINNTTSFYRFVTPETHIELIKNDITVDMDSLKASIQSKLVKNYIATNFIKIGIGEKGYVNSEQQDMGTIFSSWTSFGDGAWTYNSSTKIIANSFNSTQYTGYYNPTAVYNDIDLSFDAMSTDSDDDVIGSMIRFNKSASSYSSYLFLLDNGGSGTTSAQYNGINKIFNTNLTTANLVKLYTQSSLRWTRNIWQNYRFVASGNQISAYLNNNLVSTVTDNSISQGSYGFFSYSQAYSYFKNVVVETFKENTLTDIVTKVSWNLDTVNIIVNLSNTSEPLLSDQNCIQLFNNNKIYYVGVTSPTNSNQVNTFLSNINNRGTFVDSSADYQTSLINYIVNLLD